MPNEKSKWRNPRMWPLWAKVALACGLIIGGLLAIPPDWLQTYQAADGAGTTVVFEALAYDGFLENSSGTWADAWAGVSGGITNGSISIVVGDWIFFGSHFLRRGYLIFDTSSLPDDAVIESWWISVNVTVISGTGFNLTVVNGQPNYPHIPLDKYDFNKDYYAVSTASNCTVSADTLTKNVYNNFTASTEGSWISLTGYTKLCIRTDFDINNQDPGASKYVTFRGYETDADDPYSPAKLYVTFTSGPMTPFWSDLSHNTTVFGEPCEFKVYWSEAILATAIFSWNITGQWKNITVPVESGKTGQWVKTVQTLSINYKRVSYKFYAESTDGLWNVTDINTFLVFPTAPEFLRDISGITSLGTRNGIFYAGATNALYIVYLNSSAGQYQIRAFDLMTETWTGAINITAPGSVDPHWLPSVATFPNGTIAVFYGYYENITYRLTTQSADVQGDLNLLLSSWTEERTIIVSPFACYPFAISFDNSLFLLYRKSGSNKGSWFYRRFTEATGWTSETELLKETFDGDYYSYYLRPNKQGNKILITGFRHLSDTATEDVWNEDILFFYSDDEGVTWKFANGTVFTPPVNTLKVRVIDTPSKEKINANGVALDYDERIVIIGTQSKGWASSGRWIHIAYSEQPIGTSGITFKWENATLEDGTKIFGFASKIYFDYYYDQVSFWGTQHQSYTNHPDPFSEGDTVKYVATHKPSVFRVVKEYSGAGLRGGTYIYDAKTTYDIVGLIDKIEIGRTSVGTSELNGNTYIYGTKFWGANGKTILGVKVYIRSTYGYQIKVAIYNSTLHLITGSGTRSVGPTTGAWDDWSSVASLPKPVTFEGDYYYLCVKLKTDSMYLKSEYVAGAETITATTTYDDPWPNQITSYTTSEKELSIFGVRTDLIILGNNITYPEAITYSNNSTEPNSTCKFYAKWFDISGLDTALFYWNASGTMTLNGSFIFAGNPVEAWSNFTRTLPNQTGITIAWYITANDTLGNLGQIPTQYLAVGFATEITTGWNIIDEADVGGVDIGHTLLEIYWSLSNDSITVTTISKHNGTYYTFKPGYHWNENVKILAQTDKIYIYATTSGLWHHEY